MIHEGIQSMNPAEFDQLSLACICWSLIDFMGSWILFHLAIGSREQAGGLRFALIFCLMLICCFIQRTGPWQKKRSRTSVQSTDCQQIYVDLRSKSRIASKNIQEEMAKHAWRVLAVSIMDGRLRCVHLEARCVHLEAEIVWLFFLQVRLSIPTWMMIPHD
jgi:hypothetical protein